MQLGSILAVGAHPDDIELGCGATLAKAVEGGHEVRALILSSRNDEEVEKALHILGIKYYKIYLFNNRRFYETYNDISEILYDIDKKVNPDTIFIHASMDFHQDHRTVCRQL